jgi:outer membrane protein OmpA-like peptidoglycan-associated protein
MKNTFRSLLLLSVVICVTPASANYFSNPAQGTNLNIGSAPNPTPADLRRGASVEERTAPYADVRTFAPAFSAPEAIPAPAETPAIASVEAIPATIQAPPSTPEIRQFMIFFDFDKSQLTTEGRRIVADAVVAAKNTGMARITVVGHTDTVGTMRYNQALSERRALAVKTEMVRFGMNAGDITIAGRSFLDPLVPTGAGIAEPQNRRAVIDLNYELTAEIAPYFD